jgi:hypothetical protein
MVLACIDGIRLDGFSEPITIGELRDTGCSVVPPSPGIYLIVRSSECTPEFLPKSTGGWFKDKDPSYPHNMVQENWVEEARVIYVGMTKAQKGLKGRLCCFFDFGQGKRVGHRGGRMLWHLPNSEKLLVRWRTYPEGEAYSAETDAIVAFKAVYGGRRPFANMTK